MTKNPYLNALFAALYVVLVVLLVRFGPTFVRQKPDTILAPIAVLSLFVLSAAFMIYAFFLQPFLLYAEGKKNEAVKLFTKTLVAFAVITAAVIIVAFSI